MTAALELPPELTIYTVGELHAPWRAWLAALRESSTATADVHAAAVEELDAAGLQLLVALFNGAAQAQVALRLVDASRALLAGCEALGLTPLLGVARDTEGAAA